MNEGKYKVSTAIIVVGAALMALVLIAGGFSAVITPKADGAAELEDAAAHDGVFRPYVEVDFDYVAFSGLYLTNERDEIEVWVMWGFTRDAVSCFYQKADGKDIDGDGVFNEDDAPADAYNIEYILRAPEPSYADHNDWVLSQSRADTAEYYGLTEEEGEALFSDGVLSAARKDRMIAQVALGAGLVMLIAGIAMFVLRWKKRNELDAEAEHEYYVPPESETDEIDEPRQQASEESDELLDLDEAEDMEEELDEDEEMDEDV